MDMLITEILKEQTAMETSLLQALFSEVKQIIRYEVVKLLKEIKEKVDKADIQIDDLDLDHLIDRVVMYIVCGGNILLCGITIYLFLSVRHDIIERIDLVIGQAGVQVEERRPLLGAPLPGASGGSCTVAVSQSRHPSTNFLPDEIRNKGIAGPPSNGTRPRQ